MVAKGEMVLMLPLPKASPKPKLAPAPHADGAENELGVVDAVEVEVPNVPYEEMTIEQLQAAILAKMAANGPITSQMRRDVTQNIWPDSLLNWVRSF